MTTIEVIFEFVKYLLPAALVLGTIVFYTREIARKKEVSERYAILQKTFAQVVPLRLQAYERALLFLERIKPENLVIRCGTQGKSARALHLQMVSEIREEYEHNLAQQLYVDSDSWAGLIQAKEQVVALIHKTAAVIPADAPAGELAKRLLNEMVKAEMAPCHRAISELKADVQKMFRF